MPSNPKKVNQDGYVAKINIGSEKDVSIYSVCDGHGTFGHLVSNYIVDNMGDVFLKHNKAKQDVKLTIYKTFQELNKELGKTGINTDFSGTTSISAFLVKDFLYVSNIGDSRAVMGIKSKNKWETVELSRDHKPELASEAKRILNFGGRIQPSRDQFGNFVGPQRVWLGTQNIPGLAMTRSIGDEVAGTVGVIWEPEIYQDRLTADNKFIVIASDGVWEFIDSEECVRMIAPFYEKKSVEQASDYFMQQTLHRWVQIEDGSRDDITFIIVFLNVTE
eukprot:TRINITY_DN1268_c0_g2_i1.p2 TRINITY_DN1268_c0_g2~~TRINITY_DN1268_c0_g2_i1.p2  ORF type:complete len:276 (+),score=19.85 TRINITY_DN1268_c0_g2_i1:1-828(+)